jgi:hypothetical protein
MAETTWSAIDFTVPAGPIDCACVIHGNAYNWEYVERLYNMLNRHITPGIRLHVYTEADRPVPPTMIKHELVDWKIGGPKKSWWYKVQVFNAEYHQGPLLYFDLDTVITDNIDWIWQSSLQHFWTVRDFKYLWNPTSYTINSSIMWFNTMKFNNVYQKFIEQDINCVLKKYRGDQDYLVDIIPHNQRKFLDIARVKSWRWQALDGGFNFRNRTYQNPGTGTKITNETSVLIFHGKPKPDSLKDPVILHHWQ